MEAMAEASRLTRQGRLVEATALIQQTLAAAEPSVGVAPRYPISPPVLPARGGAQLRGADSGRARRLRAFPGLGTLHPGPARRACAAATQQVAGRFDAFSYTSPAGTRTYRLYVPAERTGANLPLVVMLHGGSQDAATFAAATGMNALAEREKFLVVYPEQARSANAGQYWNWFVPGHQRRDAGEPSLIAGITGHVIARYPVDAAQVYVAGFSAGGAMAAVMAAVYPDVYAAVGVHSGLAYASAADVASAFAAMKHGPARPARPPADPRPLIVFHGDRDTTVAHANAAHLIDHVLAASNSNRRPGTAPVAVTSGGQVPGGQAYTRACYQDLTGAPLAECWIVHQGGHAWSGGAPHGSYTNPRGPNASAEFIRFFNEHPALARGR